MDQSSFLGTRISWNQLFQDLPFCTELPSHRDYPHDLPGPPLRSTDLCADRSAKAMPRRLVSSLLFILKCPGCCGSFAGQDFDGYYTEPRDNIVSCDL